MTFADVQRRFNMLGEAEKMIKCLCFRKAAENKKSLEEISSKKGERGRKHSQRGNATSSRKKLKVQGGVVSPPRAIPVVFPTVLGRRARKGECEKALCSDCSLP